MYAQTRNAQPGNMTISILQRNAVESGNVNDQCLAASRGADGRTTKPVDGEHPR